MIKETLTCDISNREHYGDVSTVEVQVIFDHDQEDGRSSVPPYFCKEKIEICEGCWDAMMKERKQIYGYGAMGYNTYTL